MVGRIAMIITLTKHRFVIERWGILLFVLMTIMCVPRAGAQDEKGCEGVGYAKHTQSEYSLESLKKRLEKDPKDVDALIHTGLHVEEKEGFAQAEALYERAIQAKPDCYLGYYFAGLVEDRISRKATSDAELNISKAVNLNPSLHDDGNVQGFIKRHAQPTGSVSSMEKRMPTESSQIVSTANRFSIGLGLGILLAVIAFYIGRSRSTAPKDT